MDTLLVTAIVLVASVGVIRHLIKKFSAPGKKCCSGGCCGGGQSVNHKGKKNNAIQGGD